jgi:hypothetical protein
LDAGPNFGPNEPSPFNFKHIRQDILVIKSEKKKNSEKNRGTVPLNAGTEKSELKNTVG